MDSWTTSFTIASAGAGAAAASGSTGASGSGSKRGAGLRLRRFDGEAGWLPDGILMGLPYDRGPAAVL